MEDNVRKIAQNKKAWHDYFIEETFETGIELYGTEVKSIRQAKVNLKESYAAIDKGQIFVHGMHISPYEKGNIFNKDPLRARRLLLHKREISKLLGQTMQKGFSLVPLSIYLKGQKVKLELALVRGKKLYDKRDDAARKDSERDIARALRGKEE